MYTLESLKKKKKTKNKKKKHLKGNLLLESGATWWQLKNCFLVIAFVKGVGAETNGGEIFRKDETTLSLSLSLSLEGRNYWKESNVYPSE